MPLGIDATLRYRLNNWTQAAEAVRARDATRPTTRASATGLPPTPIGNPGLASIKAARTRPNVPLPLLRRQAVRQRRARLQLDRRAVPARRRGLQPQARASSAARTRRTARSADEAPRRPRLAGRPQPLAGDAQRRARRARPRATGATSGCRCRPSCSPRPCAPCPARASPAPTSRSRTRRRRSRWPTRPPTAARAIGAANTLTLRADGAIARRQHRRARAARGARRPRARGSRAGARRGRLARAPSAYALREAGAARRGLEPHARARPRAGGRPRRRGGRRAGAPPICSSTARRSGSPIRRARSRNCPLTADALGEYASVVDLVYRAGGTVLAAGGAAPGCAGGRRPRGPGPAGRAELRGLDRPGRSTAGDAGRRARDDDSPTRHEPRPSPSAPGAARDGGRRGAGRRPVGAPTRWNGDHAAPRAPRGGPRFLTDVIVELGSSPRERVERRSRPRARPARTPEDVLVDSGALIAEDALARAIAERHGLDHLDLTVFHVDMAAANLISPAAAKRYEAVPVAVRRRARPARRDGRPGQRPRRRRHRADDRLRGPPRGRLARGHQRRSIARLTRLDDVVARRPTLEERARTSGAEVVDLRESADDAPVIKLVNQIIAQAVEQGASDVHLEPDGHELRVRFRIDGVLHRDSATVPRRMVSGVIARVKIMSDLDIAERRVPAGRPRRPDDRRPPRRPARRDAAQRPRRVDRHAHPGQVQRRSSSSTSSAWPTTSASASSKAFHQAYGAVLVTGPTGSGKSTSLYAALGELNTPEKNIITIEDPVEYQIDGHHAGAGQHRRPA